MKRNFFKSGVSMIILVVTIIAIAIIAGTIVLSTAQGGANVVNMANQTSLKNDIKVMITNYETVYNDLEYKYAGDLSLIKDEEFQNKDIIPGKYSKKFEVNRNGIKYIGSDNNEKQIAKEMGVITD